MDELAGKLIKVLIPALLLGGGGGYYYVERLSRESERRKAEVDKKEERINALERKQGELETEMKDLSGQHKIVADKCTSLESKKRELEGKLLSTEKDRDTFSSRLAETQAQLSGLKSKYASAQSKHEALLEKHKALEERYEEVTKAEGSTVAWPSLNQEWHQVELVTGEGIRFKLSTSALDIKVVRITDRGPVVRITTPRPLHISSGSRKMSDGERCYLLVKAEEFVAVVENPTNRADLERIELAVEDFKVYPPKATIRGRKTPAPR